MLRGIPAQEGGTGVIGPHPQLRLGAAVRTVQPQPLSVLAQPSYFRPRGLAE
jgi:hypothetical protein